MMEQGVGATTPTNPPAGDVLETFQITDQTGFKLPKGTVIHDEVKKSITEKDKYIAKHKDNSKELDSAKARVADLERELQTVKGGAAPEKFPDPIESPEMYAQRITQDATITAKSEVKRIKGMETAHTAELQHLAELVNTHFADELQAVKDDPVKQREVFVNRCKEVTDALKQRQWGFQRDGEDIYLQSGIIDDVFKSHFASHLIEQAEKRGLKQMQEQVDKGGMGGSIPGAGGEAPKTYKSVQDLVNSDPAAAAAEAERRLTKEMQDEQKRRGG
jgi:hypothetical protein